MNHSDEMLSAALGKTKTSEKKWKAAFSRLDNESTAGILGVLTGRAHELGLMPEYIKIRKDDPTGWKLRCMIEEYSISFMNPIMLGGLLAAIASRSGGSLHVKLNEIKTVTERVTYFRVDPSTNSIVIEIGEDNESS